jgi:hypothetical protein
MHNVDLRLILPNQVNEARNKVRGIVPRIAVRRVNSIREFSD